MTDLRYPIGTYDPKAPADSARIASAIGDIEALPKRLRAAVTDLSDEQLDTPYRPGGWTVRQLVHHLADSHLNACIRLRLALTEEAPTIRTYDQELWADLSDARELPLEPSLAMLDGLHERWAYLLRSLDPEHLERPLLHPEIGRLSIAQLTCLYGWHSRHHVAHITSLRDRQGWAV